MRWHAAALLVALAAVAGCSSPEASRSRGSGPGADVGNRSRVVEMHEGSRPYWRTPERIRFAGPAPTGPAMQADRLSRDERPSASVR